MEFTVAVFPGDGIGIEVVEEAKKVISAINKLTNIKLNLQEGIVGGASIDKFGVPLTEENLELALSADAVLLGAVGGPKWEPLDYSIRPERALLALRKELNLFANLRPAKIFPQLMGASTLKPEVVKDIDLLVVRELTGGLYFAQPKGVEKLSTGKRKGINTLAYTEDEIERIARKAFEIARQRRKKVTSVDKANVLEATELWRDVVEEVHKEYPDIELNHMYVDNCAMQLVRNPAQFDVIVTCNMFGDVLSDEASMLTGSIGMLPSASLGEKGGMYEPVHGSAPDIAGQGKANPIATILSVAMMYKYTFKADKIGDAIEKAVAEALEEGYRTPDIYTDGSNLVGTSQMGNKIIDNLTKYL